jgi:trehalose 6-phosphate synthase/phosphatase
MAEAIRDTLEMPEDEQRERLAAMQDRLRRYNVERWAGDFLEKLEEMYAYSSQLQERRLTPGIRKRLVAEYRDAGRRLLLFSYDGTLVHFTRRPSRAEPDSQVMSLLGGLATAPGNEVVIISGREKNILTRWLADLPVSLVAEHGVWIKQRGQDWHLMEPLRQDWKPEVYPILEMYMDRTPGSSIEEKEYSLVWHYRRSDPDLVAQRVNELKMNLLNLTENLDVGILEGNKVIEIKNMGVNKGTAALSWLQEGEYDFVLVVGNDITDEDMYDVLPDGAFSIKVGLGHTKAKYNAVDVEEVRGLLMELAGGQDR